MIKLFDCPRDKNGLRLTAHGCGKTYKKVAALAAEKEWKENGPRNQDGSKKTLAWGDKVFLGLNQHCINCKIGERNMGELKPETKTCLCGKVFSRRDGESLVSWSRKKYCDGHSKMSSYQRKKDFEKLGVLDIQAKAEPVKDASKSGPVAVDAPALNHVEKTEKKKTEMRTCSGICGRDLELTTQNFHQNGDCLSSRCKDCRNLDKRLARSGKMIVDLNSPPKGIVILDLRKENGLQDKMVAWARAHRRSVCDQILWHFEDIIAKEHEGVLE